MSYFSEFSAEEIQKFEEIEFQKEKENRLHYLVHGEHISARHKKYCEQKRKKQAAKAASTKSSTSTIEDDQSLTRSIRGKLDNDANSGSDWSYSSPEGVSQTEQPPLGRPKVVTIENCEHSINMFSSRNGQWYPLLATLDTETTESWISRSIVDRLGLDVTNDRTTIGTTVNGKQLSSGSIVTPTWCSMGRGITHVTVFRVVNNGPCDVLFGRNILFSPEINFFVEERGCNPILPITTPSPDAKEQAQIKEREVVVQAESADAESSHRPVKPRESKYGRGRSAQRAGKSQEKGKSTQHL